MSSGAQITEKIDLSKYLKVLNRRKWWGIIPCILVATGFALFVLAIPDKYISSCTIEASQSEVVEMYEGRQRRRQQSAELLRDEITRYHRVMQSLAGTEPMREIERRAGGDPRTEALLREQLWRRVNQNLNIHSMGRGTRIRVSYLGETPDQAYTILRALTQDFVETALSDEKETAAEALRMAEADLEQAQEHLAGIESELQRLLEDNPSAAVEGVGGPRHQRMAQLSYQTEHVEDRIYSHRSRIQSLTETIEGMPAKVIDRAAEPAEDPDVALYRRQLVELRSRLNNLTQRYTERHPEVQATQAEIQAVRGMLVAAESRAAAEAEPELKPNRARQEYEQMRMQLLMQLDADQDRLERLKAEMNELQEELIAVPQLVRQRRELERSRNYAIARYQNARNRYSRIRGEYELAIRDLVSFQIISPARRPLQPDYRHKTRYAMMGLFVSLVVGFGAVAGTEFMDQSFSDVEAARNYLHLPSLGVIPVIETDSDRRRRRIKSVLIGFGVALVVAAIIIAALGPASEEVAQLWEVIQRAVRRLA